MPPLGVNPLSLNPTESTQSVLLFQSVIVVLEYNSFDRLLLLHIMFMYCSLMFCVLKSNILCVALFVFVNVLYVLNFSSGVLS